MQNRHPHLLRAEQTILIVIDMQEPFLRGVRKYKDLIRGAGLLVKAARILNVPVLATLQYRDKMGEVVPQIAEQLPEDCAPFDKMCFSSAGDESASRALADHRRRQVLLCGVETHICVGQTALDLLAGGYQVHVAADAVSSRHKETHRLGLEKMRQSGVIITSAEAAVYEMLYSADAPPFKEILSLIKETD